MSNATCGRFEAYFHASPDAIVVVDGAGQIVRANERVSDLFGYEPGALEGEPVERLVPEHLRSTHVADRDAFLADPERRPMGAGLDLRARRADGSTVPVDISLSPIQTGDGVEVMAAIRDVSEQERLRSKYRTLLETVPDAIVVADAETGEIVEVNDRATDLFGADREDLVGRHQADLHPPEDADRYRELFARHVEAGEVVATTFPDGSDIEVVADGERVPVEISVQATDLGDRRVLMGLFRDVSTRRAYERDLERQVDRLETVARLLSHDLRNPLNVAAGYTERARETGDVEYLSEIDEAHERMDEIVECALALVSEETDTGSREVVSLADLVRDCWDNVTTREATLDVVDSAALEVDPPSARHLFENLFRNAVEHGGEDVTVRVGTVEDGFYVADDGPGIPADIRETVFEAGHSTRPDGTGLGLDIVAEVAAAHGWEVAVTDGRNGGARFEFTGVEVAPDGG